MVPEAECLALVEEILTKLDIGKFETRVRGRYDDMIYDDIGTS